MNFMRKLKSICILLIVLSFSTCIQERRTYCGKVSEKYILDRRDYSEYKVVFYCDSLQKYIIVDVSGNTYVNLYISEDVCFKLSDYDIEK